MVSSDDPMTNSIKKALGQIPDPNTGKSLHDSKSLGEVRVEDDQVVIEVILGYPAKSFTPVLEELIRRNLNSMNKGMKAQVHMRSEIQSHTVQKNLKPLRNIKNIIAVASGKGGVGKSTTAVNLALALSTEGANVGILDADIYGPSQPRMLGIKGQQPESRDGKTLEAVESHGLQAMSIGFLVEEDTPMIWRGPMVTQALEQLLADTNWRDLDYLVIDLPPGTGDVQLTLAQKIPVSGAVIVTTPQDIALLDARKSIKMFERVDVPILGIVENMSIHICSQCGHEEYIFGSGGGDAMARAHNVRLLGCLPLERTIREQADGGTPTMIADPTSHSARIYCEIARRTAGQLAVQAKDYSTKFPKIVIQNT